MGGSLLAGDRTEGQPIAQRLDNALSLPEIFEAFRELPRPVFLDSALVNPQLGHFSYLSADPFLVLRSKGRRVEVEERGKALECLDGDPLAILQGLLRRFHLSPLPGLPPFQGGALGYLAYELAHHIERLPGRASDYLGIPEMNVAFYDWTIGCDHETGSVWAVATGLPEGAGQRARERLEWIDSRLELARGRPKPYLASPGVSDVASNFSREGYLEAIKKVKGYIARGDVYQVNISQRFEATIACEPWELYLRLRRVNPAPFAAYLQYPEVAVLSASPEEFLHLEAGQVRTRPMKGTRPRGRNATEDLRLAQELRASEKDRAENVMIVDLMRNDLGRVCVPGSISVPELFVVEQYSTVIQMVSTVSGVMRPGLDGVDLLRACFPGGSVTGTPKIRAMEIIDELELTQRSVYCGGIGYIGFDGSLLTCIPIRALLVKGRRTYFQVGGGIVADSDPQAEYEETMHKARGAFQALGVHER